MGRLAVEQSVPPRPGPLTWREGDLEIDLFLWPAWPLFGRNGPDNKSARGCWVKRHRGKLESLRNERLDGGLVESLFVLETDVANLVAAAFQELRGIR